MKNLFVFISVFFGVFILSLLTGVIFLLYNYETAKTVAFIISAVFFVFFILTVIIGYIKALKHKKSDSDN